MSARKESARTTNSNEWTTEQEIIQGICNLANQHDIKVVPQKDKSAGKMYLLTDLVRIQDTHAPFVDALKRDWKAVLKISTGEVYHIEVARPRLWSYTTYSMLYLLAGVLLLVAGRLDIFRKPFA